MVGFPLSFVSFPGGVIQFESWYTVCFEGSQFSSGLTAFLAGSAPLPQFSFSLP